MPVSDETTLYGKLGKPALLQGLVFILAVSSGDAQAQGLIRPGSGSGGQRDGGDPQADDPEGGLPPLLKLERRFVLPRVLEPLPVLPLLRTPERLRSLVQKDPIAQREHARLRPIASRPSSGERALGLEIARILGSPVARQQRVIQEFSADHDPPISGTARGIQTVLADKTVVERFLLPNPQAAFRYALDGAGVTPSERGQDALLEVRGRQVVVIRGEGLDDPSRARDAFTAAWSGPLPKPTGPPSATATYLAENEGFVIVTRRSDSVLDQNFNEALDKARERAEKMQPGFTRLGDSHYGFGHGTDSGGEISRANGTDAVLYGKTPEVREQLAQHLDRAMLRKKRQTPPSSSKTTPLNQGRAYGGAGGALDRLFD